MMLTPDEYMALMRLLESSRESEGASLALRSDHDSNASPSPAPKKKRKVSKYQKTFGKQLEMLKMKHPRTPVTKLMDKAHTATRKLMGMPRRRRG
tara:strand:- start:1406 stop:1690 length:285 start_codon:yes stop_codon:yes gene_type:complete